MKLKPTEMNEENHPAKLIRVSTPEFRSYRGYYRKDFKVLNDNISRFTQRISNDFLESTPDISHVSIALRTRKKGGRKL